MVINYFKNERLVTYSELLYLKINDGLLDNAQNRIYAKSQASESNLLTSEKVNSIIAGLQLPSKKETDSFRVAFQYPMSLAYSLKKSKYAPFRLTQENYSKIQTIIGLLEDMLGEISKHYKNFFEESGYKENENISIIVNAILCYADQTDYLGNSKKG